MNSNLIVLITLGVIFIPAVVVSLIRLIVQQRKQRRDSDSSESLGLYRMNLESPQYQEFLRGKELLKQRERERANGEIPREKPVQGPSEPPHWFEHARFNTAQEAAAKFKDVAALLGAMPKSAILAVPGHDHSSWQQSPGLSFGDIDAVSDLVSRNLVRDETVSKCDRFILGLHRGQRFEIRCHDSTGKLMNSHCIWRIWREGDTFAVKSQEGSSLTSHTEYT